MNTESFDLNDIANEPTDEQLNALMNDVIVEVRKKAVIAHEQLMEMLRKEIRRVNQVQGKQ
ncbi:MAG: hypothetical protein IIB26_03645 [Chloroflexi bacterium]|nr:hypothetical protein [Chloroflexota bacterium]